MDVSAFIEIIHKGQLRKSGEKYTAHLYSVRDILLHEGIEDSSIITSVLLHDSLEDGGITKPYLSFRFGDKVADIVCILSKKCWHTKYCRLKSHVDAIAGSWGEHRGATVIKMADRLHNLKTIQVFPRKKQREYVDETREYLLPLFQKMLKSEKDRRLRCCMQNLIMKICCEVIKIEDFLSTC